MPSEIQQILSQIPSVERILSRLESNSTFRKLIDAGRREQIRDIVRQLLDDIRQEVRSHQITLPGTAEALLDLIDRRLLAQWEQSQMPQLRSVINATGVVLHTNLGRAPLAVNALTAVINVSRGYSNLEYDLGSGKRGQRHLHCEAVLQKILACESAVVVNNCAASVLLTLDTFCQDGEVLISRGELIEIGGGFRIPDVMKKSRARLVEVGTTNKTRLSDYEQAISPQTRMILRVHPSNFRLIGFSQKPELAELTTLAKQHNLLCFEDLGSGALIDLTPFGIDEPLVKNSIAAGVDLVAFSGDKLLGGPQAGIIAGRRDLVSQIKNNPLMRALRVDKMVYAALEATLRLYLDGLAAEEIPALVALTATPEQLAHRARRLVQRVKRKVKASKLPISITLQPGFSLVGGGSAPQVKLPTTLIGLQSTTLSAVELEARLRSASTPVISRVEHDFVFLDLRTVSLADEKHLEAALLSIGVE
ncbi:MAG: L-seryl-tRNA(Sec) selenium transferase [Acidobacteria bacterium]|nr:L-seryl-tRNA(Sec) selenium transferase [Acidobacteriota bacterium]